MDVAAPTTPTVPHLPFTVTGPSCDSSDTMFYGVALPATIDVGDMLYIGSAGAYTLSYASAFNGFDAADAAVRRHGPRPVATDARHRPGITYRSPAQQRGRRRAGPGGLRRAGRLRELLVSGVVDSFGMALGWTVLVLLAVSRGGLAEAALYNAAMLAGVVLSAPVTGWLARRFTGRTLLRGAGRHRDRAARRRARRPDRRAARLAGRGRRGRHARGRLGRLRRRCAPRSRPSRPAHGR